MALLLALAVSQSPKWTCLARILARRKTNRHHTRSSPDCSPWVSWTAQETATKGKPLQREKWGLKRLCAAQTSPLPSHSDSGPSPSQAPSGSPSTLICRKNSGAMTEHDPNLKKKPKAPKAHFDLRPSFLKFLPGKPLSLRAQPPATRRFAFFPAARP